MKMVSGVPISAIKKKKNSGRYFGLLQAKRNYWDPFFRELKLFIVISRECFVN